jgi:hypothetical protein
MEHGFRPMERQSAEVRLSALTAMQMESMNEMTEGTVMAISHTQVFRREGEYWTLEFAGVTCRIKDTTGVRYLALLLREPHRRVPALDIVRSGERPIAAAPAGVDADPIVRERARINVTRAIGAALKRIDEHHPALAGHLRATVRTGQVCTYTPDPRLPVTWEM